MRGHPTEIDASHGRLGPTRCGPTPTRAGLAPDPPASRRIAALLMDQTILSAFGNFYRAEVLFRNG